MKQRLYSFHEVTVREERFGEQSLAGILVGTFVTRVVLKPQNVYIEMACRQVQCALLWSQHSA